MSWHVHDQLLEGYARGTLAAEQGFSVEAHLLSCETCRAGIARFVDGQAIERLWSGIDTQLMAPEPGLIERGLVRTGIPDHIARLLAATPSLRVSWLLSVIAVFAIAVAVAHGVRDGYLLFFVVAPLLPVAGIAAAYGPGIDPTYEIGVAAPMRSFGLLIVRSVAVLTTTTAFGIAASLFLPQLDWRVWAWMMPAFGLVTICLAVSTIVHPLWAAGGVALAWVGVVITVAAMASGPVLARAVFGGVFQTLVLLITIGALALLMTRRDEFDKGEHQ